MLKHSSNTIDLSTRATRNYPNSSEFDELVTNYSNGLRNYLRKSLPGEHDIEDIVQEVFCRILEYKKLDHINNPGAFLFKTARNILIDRFRKRSIQNNAFDNSHSTSLDPQNSDNTFLRYEEMALAFKQALHELQPRCQQVFLMRRFDGLTSPEVAEVLGISVRMVQKHMINAMTHFHLRLR